MSEKRPRSGRWPVLALLLVPAIALGAESASQRWTTGSEPLQIESHSLEARSAENLVVFEGDVIARQGDLTLQADRLQVTVDAESRDIRSAQAQGRVRIQWGEVVAAGEQATYDAKEGVVTLTGEPKVWRGRDVVAGDKITLFLAEDRSVVEGARAVLFPGESGARGKP